eukprot:jgi/Tetstr1/439343/TSEL_027781.t1
MRGSLTGSSATSMGCTFRGHPQQTPGSQLRYDVADLLERNHLDAAEWDGNKTELAGFGFSVTDDEATDEYMVVAYFTCNTSVEYRASVLKAPRALVTVSLAGPTAMLNSDTGVAGSLLNEVPGHGTRASYTAWHEGILGQHYKNGTTPPLNALCTEMEDVCEVTPTVGRVRCAFGYCEYFNAYPRVDYKHLY